jgi:hypothetical protein
VTSPKIHRVRLPQLIAKATFPNLTDFAKFLATAE